MSKIFLYPKTDKFIGSPNPYIANFITALSKNHTVVNKNAKNKGVLNLFRYLFKTDIFIFNWIESLSEKRNGKLQIVLFVIFTICAKITHKKIIWILHNKYSHHKKNDSWTDFMYRFIMAASDKIITHSESGREFVESNYPKFSKKVSVIIHPVSEMFKLETPTEKCFDFLIWGSIYPYKGIDKFLSHIKRSPKDLSFKILLVGKCFSPAYKEKIHGLLSENITFHDELFEMEEIAEFSRKSKFTLFTYQSESVISSGSLIDAIRMGATVIGPNHGGFKDLSHYSFMHTYDSFEEVFLIPGQYASDLIQEQEERLKFCKENSWQVFIEKLEAIFQELK